MSESTATESREVPEVAQQTVNIHGIEWELCPVDGCEFAVCKWGGIGKCHPHSVEEVGAEEMERRYNATREPDGSWNGKVGA